MPLSRQAPSTVLIVATARGACSIGVSCHLFSPLFPSSSPGAARRFSWPINLRLSSQVLPAKRRVSKQAKCRLRFPIRTHRIVLIQHPTSHRRNLRGTHSLNPGRSSATYSTYCLDDWRRSAHRTGRCRGLQRAAQYRRIHWLLCAADGQPLVYARWAWRPQSTQPSSNERREHGWHTNRRRRSGCYAINRSAGTPFRRLSLNPLPGGASNGRKLSR